MKKILALMILLTTIIATANAGTLYPRQCGSGTNDFSDVDLCDWNPVLPLGSPDCCSCNLNYNTYWPVNTNATATCTFEGSGYEDYTLYMSIDNDVIWCKLNGETIFNKYVHENCAPADPRDPVNGQSVEINPTAGTNTLTCYVSDRGSMSHFDACVVGEEPVTHVPEAALAVGLIALLTPGVIYLVRRKR
jgi:hypothetical protein